MDTHDLLTQAEQQFAHEPKLIEIGSGRVVFVGDTHGDIEATRHVTEKYLNRQNTLVFLGDYVDRGPASSENLGLLLTLKLEYPENLFLLMGNHEGQKAVRFHPADFWQSLTPELFDRYGTVLSNLPFAASTSNGIIALHGALPAVDDLAAINAIEFGSDQWKQATWGDWRDEPGASLGEATLTGRPQFGRDWFEEIMLKLGKNVLVRSHQPDAAPLIFDDRCLTIFTTSAYQSTASRRTIAITDLENEVTTARDLTFDTF